MNGKPRDGNAAAGLRTVDQARRSLERERGRADQRKARPVQSWPLRENVINQERQSGGSRYEVGQIFLSLWYTA
jgi:hypothetical protein